MNTYSHSGTVPVAGAMLTVVAGGAAAVVGGIVYAYAFYYNPIIELSVLITLGFAAGIGCGVALAARAGKVRNNWFVGAVAFFSTLLGLYVYWAAYLWATSGIGQWGLLAFSPDILLGFAKFLFDKGSWGLHEGDMVKGWFLAALWVIEAVLVLGIAMVTSRMDAQRPFCDSCQQWTDIQKGIARLASDGTEPAWNEVLAGDLPALAAFAPAHAGVPQFVRLDVARCPKCEQSRFLTASAIQITVDKNGKASEHARSLITNAMVTPAQFAVVEACGALYDNRLGDLGAVPAPTPPAGVSDASPPAEGKS